MNKFASSEEMDAAWSEADAKVSKSIRKLETHQLYAGDKGLDAFRKKNYESIKKSATKMFEADIAFYEALLRRRILFTRLRLVELPITDYTKFEFLTYKIGARYGERIGILNKKHAAAKKAEKLNDFVVYDDFLVIFNYFDSVGNHLGSNFSRNKKVVAGCIAAYDTLLGHSTPLGHFEASNKAILDATAI